MFTHILVPLDGSLLAEQAVSHAEKFSRAFGGKITLLQVLDPTPVHNGPGAVEPLDWQIRKAEAEMYLQGIAARFRGSGIEVSYEIREGRPAENIVDFAHQGDIDLVILSTHGASGISRWNTSSVTNKVLEKIYLPVLLIRAYQPVKDKAHELEENSTVEQTPAPPKTTGSGMVERNRSLEEKTGEQTPSQLVYKRILLPIDTSRRAECALPAVVSIARSEIGDQPVIILGAVINPPDLPVPAPYPEEIRLLIERFLQLSRMTVENYLHDLVQRLQLNCETRIVEKDNISTALHELVDQEDIDLVVLCAHGQTGGTSWPYGSVARNYLEHGTRSVLVIQDVPLQQVHPTAVEIAAEKYGRR